MGALLFLLYIHDLFNSVPGKKIKLFADDTNLFVSAKMNELEPKANSYLLNLVIGYKQKKTAFKHCQELLYCTFSE